MTTLVAYVAVASTGRYPPAIFAFMVRGSVGQHRVQHPPCAVAVIPESDPA